MTEAEWLACAEPRAMLGQVRGRVSDRKLRLFGCACCRRAGLGRRRKARGAVEAAEGYADGGLGPEDLWAAFVALDGAPEEARRVAVPREFGTEGARAVSESLALTVGRKAQPAKPRSRAGRLGPVGAAAAAAERAAHCVLLREVLGNPFRTVAVSSAWLAWEGGTVRRLARALYDERAFDRLPVLADALEEAGCDNADVLNHCRGPGEHVRGCWVLDLLLGRE